MTCKPVCDPYAASSRGCGKRLHLKAQHPDGGGHCGKAYDQRGVGNGHLVRCSATIAARTASAGDVTGGKCSTAKNRRLSLPSIGDDQA
jgi:hypothetical protein